MTLAKSSLHFLIAAAAAGALGVAVALAVTTVPTPKLVTNTKGGQNQNASINRTGKLIVFTSNVDHVVGVDNSPAGTFDFDSTGNDFTPPAAVHPNPTCVNCAAIDSAAGQLYLWRQDDGIDPANSLRQLTFVTGGGFAANLLPDINQRGTVIAWDSDRDHTPGSPGNADGNREIFLLDVATFAITQVTNTLGNAGAANRNANWSDTGTLLVFDSESNFTTACTLDDGSTPCDNVDGNSEIMLFDRSDNTFTQITKTTGDAGTSNIRPRISNDGRFVAFQSTRDFSGVLPAGATCTRAGGGACGNDGNGEIMLFDRVENAFTQVTNTTNSGSCAGATPNERVEISKRGRYVTWQSKCESQLNAAGCGSCNGNDEAFLFSSRRATILQLTISDAGFNRVPRVAGGGRFIIFESNRNYKNLNPAHFRTLYIIKRSSMPAPPGTTAPSQVVEDAGSPLVQNSKTKLVTINFAGGFNTAVEQFGASTNGRFYAFDNKKGVKNQEIWFLDRNQ
jgi:Tol biopolymer transport system component